MASSNATMTAAAAAAPAASWLALCFVCRGKSLDAAGFVVVAATFGACVAAAVFAASKLSKNKNENTRQ